jgi:tetratricopeptide (TPR) repeat protein
MDTLFDKGQTLFEKGNYSGAIAYYDKALAIDPFNLSALAAKGDALDSLSNYTRDIAYYDKALKLEPSYKEALFKNSSDYVSYDGLLCMIVFYHKYRYV